jgi:putative ABC transport system permease protein
MKSSRRHRATRANQAICPTLAAAVVVVSSDVLTKKSGISGASNASELRGGTRSRSGGQVCPPAIHRRFHRMTLWHTARLACRALRRNPLRSTLTGLGLIIGVAAVIALVSFGNGAKARIEAQIADLGENLLLILPGSFRQGGVRSGWGGRSSLKPEDAHAIAQEVPGVVGVSAEVRSRSQVISAGRNWNTVILGESPDYPLLRNWRLAAGAMFDATDVQRIAKVAVIGQTIVNELFPDGNDPLGRIVRIGNVPFRIVGVLAPKGFSVNGQDQDDIVIIPYTSHLRRISRRDYLNSVIVQLQDPSLFAPATEEITDLLTVRHRLDDDEEPDFTTRSQMEIVERATATAETMTMMLTAIASVSLLVGGIGIMNIMLVSVTERTREIGLRLAIGAHDSDVLRQFLAEAIILSLGGGLLGVAIGVGAAHVVAQFYGWPVAVSASSLLAAVGCSAGVGIFFGYYPARRAARMDPIEALRHE